MPYGRKRKRSFRGRRKYRSRRRGRYPKRSRYRRRFRRRRNRISRLLTSATKMVKLRYSDNVTLDPGVGGIPVAHQWRLNSINDPDLTGVGHQPLGRDNWANIYRYSTVVGCKIVFEALGSTQAATEAFVMGFHIKGPEQNDLTLGSANDVVEHPKVAYRLVQPIASGGNPIGRIVKKIRIKDWAQGTRLLSNQWLQVGNSWTEDLQGSDPPFCTVIGSAIIAPSDGTNINPVYCRFTLEFICLLNNPNTQIGPD